jgi:hypothetical protein
VSYNGKFYEVHIEEVTSQPTGITYNWRIKGLGESAFGEGLKTPEEAYQGALRHVAGLLTL